MRQFPGKWLEIARPEVDYQGYDLVAEENGIVRHIQLKTSRVGARTSRQKVHVALGRKPSGCVVWIYFHEETLELGPFLYFGGAAGYPLPDLSEQKVAQHSKGNTEGVKARSPDHRVINKGQFASYGRIAELYSVLFGPPRRA